MDFEILRIALLKPNEADPIAVSKIFPRDRYSIRIVDSIEEIQNLIEEEGSPFDAILVPIHAADSQGSESLCSRLKSASETMLTPLVAVANHITPNDLTSLLDAGADLAIPISRDPDGVYAQILAQVRAAERHSIERSKSLEAVGLQQSTIRLLNLMREGILLFDPQGTLTFINSAAGRLLGIDWSTPQELFDETILGLRPLLESHIAACTNSSNSEANSLPLSLSKLLIRRADKRFFNGSIRLISITGHQSEIVGHALSLMDLSEFDLLSQSILQGHRMRTLGLLSAAACSHLSHAKKMAGSPSAIFTELHGLLPSKSSTSSTLTLVLEYLDLVLNTSTLINLQASCDFVVAVKFDDLFQLLGLSILEVSDYTAGGDISVGFSEIDEKNVMLKVSAHSTRAVPFAATDDFAALLQGSFELTDDVTKQLSSGWKTIETIASRYECRVLRHCPDQLSIEVEIKLPK